MLLKCEYRYKYVIKKIPLNFFKWDFTFIRTSSVRSVDYYYPYHHHRL